jgi:hypothetical protein
MQIADFLQFMALFVAIQAGILVPFAWYVVQQDNAIKKAINLINQNEYEAKLEKKISIEIYQSLTMLSKAIAEENKFNRFLIDSIINNDSSKLGMPALIRERIKLDCLITKNEFDIQIFNSSDVYKKSAFQALYQKYGDHDSLRKMRLVDSKDADLKKLADSLELRLISPNVL